jgi:hypothetical protein
MTLSKSPKYRIWSQWPKKASFSRPSQFCDEYFVTSILWRFLKDFLFIQLLSVNSRQIWVTNGYNCDRHNAVLGRCSRTRSFFPTLARPSIPPSPYMYVYLLFEILFSFVQRKKKQHCATNNLQVFLAILFHVNGVIWVLSELFKRIKSSWIQTTSNV